MLSSLAFAQAESEVSIHGYRFDPPHLRIPPGTTVRWINHEKRTSHSIQFSGPEALESDRLFPGESWSRRFEQTGQYPYRCGPHPEMSGVIEVAQ